MTSAQVVETSVNVTSNSPSQDYTHPDDPNLPFFFWQITMHLTDLNVLFNKQTAVSHRIKKASCCLSWGSIVKVQRKRKHVSHTSKN